MSKKKVVAGIIKKFDAFATTEFLRYKEESKYATVTGGICSIIAIILFAIMFANIMLETLRRSTLNSNLTLVSTDNPINLTTNTKDGSPFYYAIGINGINLNSPTKRYFDLAFTQVTKTSQNSTNTTSTQIPLVPCQASQWQGVNSEIDKVFTRLQFSSWLCPMENYTIQLDGKFTSEVFQYSQLLVKTCNNNTKSSDTRTCASQAEINAMELSNNGFNLNFYFINPTLNPNSQNFTTFYLQDGNFFPFTSSVGSSSNIFFSEYSVTTDSSIWPEPITDKSTSNGTISQILSTANNFQVTSDELVRLFLRKSSNTLIYDRNYKRFDNTLSYIGGLFGAIMMLLFMMRYFNECAYEIDMSDRLYLDNQKNPFKPKKFNLLTYPIYLVYEILSPMSDRFKNWSVMKTYKTFSQCRDQIGKQLDVRFLMQRIAFLEKAVQLSLDDIRLKGVVFQDKWTLNQAKIHRESHLEKDRIIKKLRNQTLGTESHEQLTNLIRKFETPQQRKQIQNYLILSFSKRSRIEEKKILQNHQDFMYKYYQQIEMQEVKKRKEIYQIEQDEKKDSEHHPINEIQKFEVSPIDHNDRLSNERRFQQSRRKRLQEFMNNNENKNKDAEKNSSRRSSSGLDINLGLMPNLISNNELIDENEIEIKLQTKEQINRRK